MISGLVIAVLYVARPVFMPIALAVLFAFLLRPIVGVLARTPLRRTASIVLSITVTLAILSLGAWTLAAQITTLAKEMNSYNRNIDRKLRAIQRFTGGTIGTIEKTLQRVADSTQKIESADMKVRVIADKKSIADRYDNAAPILEQVASAFLVVVLVFFLLKDSEQMRDRILRLAGRANFTVTTQAIGEASHRISRYLLTLAVINTVFGIVIGGGLVLIHLPHALLWGVLAAISRFVPYVGAVLSGALPTMFALAVFDGWSTALIVLALFLLVDQILAGFIEPLIVGHRVGVSPIALLVSAIFWGWLWGPVGLLLATPITVCLNVAGEFIPAARIFSILFGTDAPLEGYLSFYNRLLLRDRVGACAIADRHAEDRSMEMTFNEIFIPTLSFAAEEVSRLRISKVQHHFIRDVIRELSTRLGDRNAAAADPTKRVVAMAVAGERLSQGTTMLTQLLRVEGYTVDYLAEILEGEMLAYLSEVNPDGVFVSCSSRDHRDQGMALLQHIAERVPDAVIVSGGTVFAEDPEATLRAGATFVPASLTDGKEEFLRVVRRGRRRTRNVPGTIRVPDLP